MDAHAAAIADTELALSAEDVAEMLDTVDAANVQTTIHELEELLATRRRAASTQEKLAAVPPETLRAALVLRAQRRYGGRC